MSKHYQPNLLRPTGLAAVCALAAMAGIARGGEPAHGELRLVGRLPAPGTILLPNPDPAAATGNTIADPPSARIGFAAEVGIDPPIEATEPGVGSFQGECGAEPVESRRLLLLTDLRELPRSLWGDIRAMPTLGNAAVLGFGAGLAAISRANWDDAVRRDVADHPKRWGGFDNVLDVVGHPGTHFAFAGITYGLSLPLKDDDAREFSKAAMNSLLLTNGAVVVLKYAFDTERPDGEPYGFPSGHTASSFALAAVIEERHGLLIGAGAYTVAGLVGYSRIDLQKHDLSDVLFGAALGYAIGKTVACNHFLKEAGIEILPYADSANQSAGILLQKRF